jgi:hypothetical protein
METDELFRKLKPVLGKGIDQLWLEYQLNPESRAEIEGILHTLAAKHLDNNYEHRRVLLTPPPEDVARGEYPLGTVQYAGKPCHPFGLREDEWIQHVGIFGRTGSGKTNVGYLIVKELLKKGKPFLIFDWKRNYRDLVALPEGQNIQIFTVGRSICPFHFNPLIPPKGTSPTVWLKKLIEIMCHVYYLGEGVAYLLQKAIDAVYTHAGVYSGNPQAYPTLADVKAWLENYKAKGREGQWMDSTVRVIGTLCYGEIGKVLNVHNPVPLGELLESNAIFELDALTNADKTFFIESLMLWIHHYRLQDEHRETFKHAVIIEEAHHVLLKNKGSKETVMDVILREIRELGESIILIDQHPSLISIPSLGNTYCTIGMNLKHNRDISTLAEAMLIEEKEREYFGKLEVGLGIVKLQGRWFKPFLVKFPLVEVKKGQLTDEDLKRKMLGFSGESGDIRADGNEIEAIRVARAEDKKDKIRDNQYKELTEKEREFLEDVMRNRTSGISERYRRLGLSVDAGNKMKDAVLSSDFLLVSDVSTGKGRIKYLELSEKGKELLRQMGREIENGRQGGAEHEYWKHKIAELLKSQGYEVEMEKAVGDGGAVDIVAIRDGRKVAVEIETGKSDALANIEKDLKAGFDAVVSVAINEAVAERVKAIVQKSDMGEDRRLTICSVGNFLNQS